MEFTITAHDGDSVKVEAENWMAAMGKAMAFFHVDVVRAGRMVCDPGADGSIFVDNPSAERTWMIRPVQPPIMVVVAASSQNLAELQSAEEPETPAEAEVPPSGAPPLLTMPEVSSLHRVVQEKDLLAERLFDVGLDLSLATPEEASGLILALLMEYVPAQQVSVAYGTLNDAYLRIVAAAGAIADPVRDGTVPFGEGLIGQCFELRGTLLSHDVAGEGRHLDRVHADADPGFEVKAAACVPILDAEGLVYGVIQILNPIRGAWTDEDISAAEAVARTLGASFAEQA